MSSDAEAPPLDTPLLAEEEEVKPAPAAPRTRRSVLIAVSTVASLAAAAAVVLFFYQKGTPAVAPGPLGSVRLQSSPLATSVQSLTPDAFCPDKKCEVNCEFFDNGVFDTSLASGAPASLPSAMLSAALSYYAYPDNLMGGAASPPTEAALYSDSFQARFTDIFKQMGLAKYSFVDAQIKEKYQTHAIIAASETDVHLIFKGSSSVKDIKPDLSVACTKTDLFGGKTTCVHNGFLRSYLASRTAILDAIDAVVPAGTAPKASGMRIWLTGHSLGAALATVMAAGLQSEGYEVSGVTTFGSPRVGDLRFEEVYRGLGLSAMTYRWVHDNDVVPQLPLEIMGYRHVGQRYVLHAGRCAFRDNEDCVEPGFLPGFCEQSTDDHYMAGYASTIKECLVDEGKLAQCAIHNLPL